MFTQDAVIECEPGWENIIEDMCFSIEYFLDEDRPNNLFKINIIESKFGVLSVDCDNNTPAIKKVIDFAQKLSYYSCETCGDKGKIYCSNKWLYWSKYKTLCKDHAIKYYYYEIRSPKGKK
jgi:hypothetical protein